MLIRSVVIIHPSCMIFLFSLFHLDFTLLFSALRGVYQLRWPFQMTSFGFVNILHCVSSFDFTDFCSFLYCSLFVLQFSSVQFSRSVVSDSLQPHESQHTRPPCPSPTPGIYSNSCPSSRWCHPAISSSVIPLHWFYFDHLFLAQI